MYSSIVVKILRNIWDILSTGYEYSLLHKIINPLKCKLAMISRESKVVKLFTSDRSLLQESFFYSIFVKFIDVINRLIVYTKKGIEKYSASSIVYNTVKKLFNTEKDMINTFFVFFIAFGVGIIVNNIFRGYYSGRSYIISFILIIVSSIGIIGRLDIKEIVNESITFRVIKSIFTIDEEVDRWW